MKIPPWNFSLRRAGLDPNSSRSWTDPSRPPQKGSTEPPRPPHRATKGDSSKKKKTCLKITKKQLKNPKSPEIATSPSEIKNKAGGGGGPTSLDPLPRGHLGKGEKPCAPGGNLRTEIPRGWGGFGIRLDCVSRRCGWIFFFGVCVGGK